MVESDKSTNIRLHIHLAAPPLPPSPQLHILNVIINAIKQLEKLINGRTNITHLDLTLSFAPFEKRSQLSETIFITAKMVKVS